ncbi:MULTISPECIES: hypothetical protein [Enterococcus]|uniref:hypothetical protein n=1 Tax=Enterococcus TaxID=1350 RepID=UPI001898CF57|nr:hypothetical protein [Enterococcus mundtii]MBO1084963.1 hypothetical protein [Enterococcus mundtii]MDV7743781.1 hypothetical protein [Enterococcus mundtii]
MKESLAAEEIDINENILLRQSSELLKLLLKDRTTGRNIIWATNTYEKMGKGYKAADSITIKHVTGTQQTLIRPRVEKLKYEQKNRTKGKAEVFTTTWIVKLQADIVDEEFQLLPLEEYVEKTWLEITSGEAPYMVSRYDSVTGEYLSISERVGFVDRKLKRISDEVADPSEWIRLVKKAYQASYGYEYQGDSLLIARENLLYTFIDYYHEKFNHVPDLELQIEIAKIISYNVFQMDGLKYIIPLSDQADDIEQLDLFGGFEEFAEIAEPKGIFVKIKDWQANKLIEFRSLGDSEE